MTNPPDLFSFGTLMDTELLPLVCQQDIQTLTLEPATVQNQARRWVIDDHYPVLVPELGSVTHGLIIRGLEPEALKRIVFIEGEEFEVQPLEVVRSDGQVENVQYFADTHRKTISDTEWSLEEWQRTTKADTLVRLARYMQCYGNMTPAEADAYW